MPEPFWRDAVRRGALRGLEWGVTLLILGAVVLLLLGDYAITRQKAALGAEAYQTLQELRRQAQQQAPMTPSTPPK